MSQLNLSDLSSAVKDHLSSEKGINLGLDKCKIFTKAVVDTIREQLVEGQDISLPKLGNFKIAERDARTGRNPHTGEAIEIPAKKALTFKASSVIKRELND